MLIRPPVVREMRRNLWADMTRTPDRSAHREAAPTSGQADETADLRLARLKELGKLRDSGVLTEDEFEREKRRILG